MIAAIETAVEGWSNRLRVTELWIDDAYRRHGIGTALMDIATKRARDEKRRMLMLETQSRNENAIAFYLAYVFSLIGFNACKYQDCQLYASGNGFSDGKQNNFKLSLFKNIKPLSEDELVEYIFEWLKT